MKRKGKRKIWQSRYYDHVIRDENDLHKHLDYIHYQRIADGDVVIEVKNHISLDVKRILLYMVGQLPHHN